MKYLKDEKIISRDSGYPLDFPIRLFNIESLGFNQKEFIDFASSFFDELDWDFYDVKLAQVNFLIDNFPKEKSRLKHFFDEYFNDAAELSQVYDLVTLLTKEKSDLFRCITPYRRRSISHFEMSRKNESWTIKMLPVDFFTQPGSDYRVKPRKFSPTNVQLTSHPLFVKFLGKIAEIVKEVRPLTETLDLIFHQIRVIAQPNFLSQGSPEGIHQDSVDYIISAIVIERQCVSGGESIIYGPDKKTEYFKVTLKPGEGIFQADKGSTLWHYVTPITPEPNCADAAQRSIFGFDINIRK